MLNVPYSMNIYLMREAFYASYCIANHNLYTHYDSRLTPHHH